MAVRQPIVSVLGHVDHGKTTFLDYIRGTAVAEREAGRITQHIGATEVPLETIYEICGDLVKDKKFKVPGLLFIDTPGHHAFTTLRARGGSLADLAVLIVDVMEGLMPQTIESINILRQYKTPFVVCLNKVDRIQGWRTVKDATFHQTYKRQTERVKKILDERMYELIGKLYERGFSAERYDRIEDFTKNIALVPICAKSGEGIPDVLLLLVGLAQRFLEKRLETEEGPGEGTILEVKEEKGLGPTIDVIVYKGSIAKGDTIIIGAEEPIITKVRALLKPRPLDEIRDPKERFISVDRVTAAVGVKIAAPNLEEAVAGAPLCVADETMEESISRLKRECRIHVETSDEGIYIKADAIGSLEALAFELRNEGIAVRRAEVGDVSRKDLVETAAYNNPLHRVILGFNVKVLPEASETMAERDVEVITGKIIYKLLEDYKLWSERKREEIERQTRISVVYPGKFKILPDYVFRTSKPAVVGVRVLAGRIRPEQRLLREDGRVVGTIKSIQSEGKNLKEAIAGQEVAISIEGVTIGRQLDVEDVVYIDIPEKDAKLLQKTELSYDEKECLSQVLKIKRRGDKFWAM